MDEPENKSQFEDTAKEPAPFDPFKNDPDQSAKLAFPIQTETVSGHPVTLIGTSPETGDIIGQYLSRAAKRWSGFSIYSTGASTDRYDRHAVDLSKFGLESNDYIVSLRAKFADPNGFNHRPFYTREQYAADTALERSAKTEA